MNNFIAKEGGAKAKDNQVLLFVQLFIQFAWYNRKYILVITACAN